MTALCVITGTKREAACLGSKNEHPEYEILCSGARPDRARMLVADCISRGCRGIISFGLAGGLSADLPSGTIILPGTVIDDSGTRRRVTASVREKLARNAREAGLRMSEAPLYGSGVPVSTIGDKVTLQESTGAVAVDMESHIAGELAEAAGIPWVVIRAIADDARALLPVAAINSVREDGSISPGGLAAALLRNPGQMSDFIGLANKSRQGFRALRRVAPLFLRGDLF